MAPPWKIRGWRALECQRLMADGKLTDPQLAEKYGCTRQAIRNFRDRHADEIQEIRENQEDEFAGLWVAKKRNRLAELQKQIERAEFELDDDNFEDDDPGLSHADRQRYERIIQAAHRQIAEELGALGLKTDNSGPRIAYVIEGLNPENLK